MHRLRFIDSWESVAATIQFSVPPCIDDLVEMISRDARVVEIGCGYGRVCRQLVDRGFRNVVGYDRSPAMIKRGRQEFPDLALKLSRGPRILEHDSSVDAVVCCAVLTSIADPAIRGNLVREIERVLCPGGVLHAVEFAPSAGRAYDAEGRFRSALGIEMIHFTRRKIQAEFSRFHLLKIREFQCRSVSGYPENALLLRARKSSGIPALPINKSSLARRVPRQPSSPIER